VASSLLVDLHLAALVAYVGACLYALAVTLPVAARSRDATAQRRLLARDFRVLNPVAIGALGVALITGAARLTDLKAAFGPSFFPRLGAPLLLKLTLAFVLINIATYVAFGLGHRVVRAELGQLPVDAPWQAAVIRRLRAATVLALALAAATAWASVRLRSGP
jgi:hypothetical protein